MEDTDIIERYWAKDEQAIALTEQKYGHYCHAIAYRILENNADAQEIVNDTYLKTWNTIPPQRPRSLKAYVGMISRQLSLDAYAAKHTQKRDGGLSLIFDELSECIPDRDSGADIGDSLALRDALCRFVASLPEKTQVIFVRRYWYSLPIRALAQSCGMNEGKVRVLLFHTRKNLKAFLSKEGIEI